MTKKTKTKATKTKKGAVDLPEPSKPGMPKEPVMLDIGDGLQVKLDMDIERFSSGSMRMRIGSGAEVSEGDEKLGMVAPTMGCGVSVVVGKRDFYIPVETLWEMGKKANAEYQRRVDAGEI